MKKLVSALVVMFSLVIFSSQAFAGGKADIPYWYYFWGSSNNYVITMFTMTNRSEKALDVTLSLRDENGNPVTQNIVRIDGNYYSADNATATISAYGAKIFYLVDVSQASKLTGGGTISWEFNDETEGDCCKPLAVTVEKREFHSSLSAGWACIYQITVNGDCWF